MPLPPWSDEDIETVIELWNKGESCSLIGSRVGKSRNAVIGKVHRLKAAGKILRDGYATVTMPTAPRVKLTVVPPRAIARAPVFEEPEEVPGSGITIMELRNGLCANVSGGRAPQWLFCGTRTRPGQRFCKACRPRMYSRFQKVAAE